MEIEEYRKQFIDEIKFEAEHDRTDPKSMFIEKCLNKLEELGELNDPIPLSVEIRNVRRQLLSFDGYSYDERNGALVLIKSEFTSQRDIVPILTESRINELFDYMRRFIEEAVNDNIRNLCDDSGSAINIANEFRKKIGKGMTATEILRFKFVIISNCTLSKQIKSISQPDLLDRPVDIDVWTLERFYQILSNENDFIEIDIREFGFSGIQSMQANIGGEHSAFMCVVPGKLLADIYQKFGTKILQNHIRGFQKMIDRSNKAIRQTIIRKPSHFFEFNNGIVAIAQDVQLNQDNNIVALDNFQIIDGCQTIVTLASSCFKHETNNNLAGLFVPMKLIVMDMSDYKSEFQTDKYCEFATVLSGTTHVQLPVRTTDYSSNHPFHILMEKLSKRIFAPSVNGNPHQTIWFYERSRRRWEQEQLMMTYVQKERFCKKCPRDQVVTKEKLAKCYNAILLNPHQVCQGSSINFKYFSVFADDLYGNHRDEINEEFYKKCICSVILFDSLDRLIRNASWYQSVGNKPQIIPYAISKLMYMLPVGKDIDWKLIWKRQGLYPELEEELQEIVLLANNFLKEKAGKHLVRTTARLTATWDDFKNVPCELTEKFLNTLILK